MLSLDRVCHLRGIALAPYVWVFLKSLPLMFGRLKAFGISQSLLTLDRNHDQANGNINERKQTKKQTKEQKKNKYMFMYKR
jgi:hypothetical protein